MARRHQQHLLKRSEGTAISPVPRIGTCTVLASVVSNFDALLRPTRCGPGVGFSWKELEPTPGPAVAAEFMRE
ncbi:AraC family transcriptional regulator [Anopheles sinensis]|uniref:AraC family transcriptional regulator n=1 Tax=Anopheles sinensis TaxID=74873 RepID=A0A084VCQ8_ANOSI|nr:AraC family transcriptional regulator [Anopheles sinensis]